MKRTPFKKKPTTPLKRSGFRKPDINALKVAKRAKKTPSKTKPKGYQVPPWFRSLKPGSHGQTIHQKKYWKVVSDIYRKEEFEKYGGKCVSCPYRLERWQDGQLAHYKAWSNCYGFFKYERKNLAFSCSRCNQNNDGFVAEDFKQELQRRYGGHIIDWINEENKRHMNTKMEVWEIVERTEKLLTPPSF